MVNGVNRLAEQAKAVYFKLPRVRAGVSDIKPSGMGGVWCAEWREDGRRERGKKGAREQGEAIVGLAG